MPAVRYYEVVETRVVKIRANTAIEASKVGSDAFKGEVKKGSTPSVTDPPRVIALQTNEVGR